MAILTLSAFKARAGITSTDATRDASLDQLLADVDAAIKRAIRPFLPEPVTFTDIVLDAPRGNVLELPLVPVRSIASLYLNLGARGDATEFTADYLLVANSDYWMPLDDAVAGYSRSGRVFRRGLAAWGFERLFGIGRLAAQIDPCRGAIKVTFSAGPTSVPTDLALAAFLATTLIYQRREKGGPLSSESWNGRSESVAGPFTAGAALDSPDVAQLLRPYQGTRIGVA